MRFHTKGIHLQYLLILHYSTAKIGIKLLKSESRLVEMLFMDNQLE
jgi:hypothetical protein